MTLIETIRARNKQARKAFRDSSELRDFVADNLPVTSDWSPTIVAELICQSTHNRILTAAGNYFLDLMPKSTQYAIAKSICERLVKEGRAEKALGNRLDGKGLATTYNGVSNNG